MIQALLPILALGALTGILATILCVAHRKLAVQEDPRLDPVNDMLPLSNCGACGYPGCRAFAEALLKNEVKPAACNVASLDQQEDIASFLGTDIGEANKRVARLACSGGNNVATRRAHYEGHETCLQAAQVSGGGKSCFWGCLGHGDCEHVCDFDAIQMNQHGLPEVNEALCTGCGDCVDRCPKDLFSLQPVEQHLWVTCKNEEQGDELLEICKVACTACGRCAMDAPGNLISMQNHLPHVDYVLCQHSPAEKAAIERCPTGAIVWIENNELIRVKSKGPVLGHSELPEVGT